MSNKPCFGNKSWQLVISSVLVQIQHPCPFLAEHIAQLICVSYGRKIFDARFCNRLKLAQLESLKQGLRLELGLVRLDKLTRLGYYDVTAKLILLMICLVILLLFTICCKIFVICYLFFYYFLFVFFFHLLYCYSLFVV